MSGRIWPQLGGRPENIDIIGVNYYWNNQWIHGGCSIDMDDPSYAPLSDLLVEVAARYGRPVLVAETGRARGAEVEGICLYPIADHPGWDDDRLCPNGLLGHELQSSGRSLNQPLAEVISRWRRPTAPS